MGFQLLAIGVILLANPCNTITDCIAAVMIAAAAIRIKTMLRNFERVAPLSYILAAIGLLSIIFGYISPLEIILKIITIFRYGIVSLIEVYIIFGISEMAVIKEDAALYSKAMNFKGPIYFSGIIKALITALSLAFPIMNGAAFISGLSSTFVTIMIAVTVYHLYKDASGSKNEPEDIRDE